MTCNSCRHVFEGADGAAEISCPKCGKPLGRGVDLAAGSFDDFFEIEGNAGPEAAPPQVSAPKTSPDRSKAQAPTAPRAAAPQPSKGAASQTDDTFLSDFGDFDSLFEKAEADSGAKAPRPVQPPPAERGGVEDLLAEFGTGEDLFEGGSPADAASEPPAAAPPAPPAEEGLDDLFSDFLADDKPPAAPPPPAKAAAPAPAPPPPSSASVETVSAPQSVRTSDENLEELFSEVSGVVEEDAQGEDAIGPGLGVEYKQRRSAWAKKAGIALGSLILLVGIAAIVMARFTEGGFFGFTFGQKPADGYTPPSSRVLSQLNARCKEAMELFAEDRLDTYMQAVAEFRAILKIDERNSPTDAVLAEALILANRGALPGAERRTVETLLTQAEKYAPGRIETVRARARFLLARGEVSQAAVRVGQALNLSAKDKGAMTLSAEVALARDDTYAAENSLRAVIETDESWVRARYVLALTLLGDNRIEEGEAVLNELARRDTPHPSSELDLLRLMDTRYGRKDEAASGLKEILEAKASSLAEFDRGRGWRYLAEISDSQGRLPEAIGFMERSVNVDRGNHASGFFLGMLYLKNINFDKAAQEFARSSSLAPSEPLYIVYHGRALRELDKDNESLLELSKALEKAPSHVEGLYQLGLTQRKLRRNDEAISSFEAVLKNDPRHIESMVNLGELYLARDNFAMAKTQLRTAIAVEPGSLRAHNALGDALLTDSKPAEALEEFKTAEKSDASDVSVLTNMGKALLALDRVDDAERYFSRALSLDSTRVDTQVAFGQLQHKRKEYTRAIDTYRTVLDMQPKDFDTRVKLAMVMIDQHQFEDAVRELQEAAKWNPEYYPTRLNLGIAWRGQGSLDSSLDQLNSAAQIRSGAPEVYYHLELTHIYRNDPINAEKMMERALSLNPKFVDPIMALGDFYFRRNFYEESAKFYLRAESIEPRNPTVLLRLAEGFHRQGDLKRARQYYVSTLKADPKSTDSHLGLGVISEDAGKLQEALRHYQAAQRADPNDARPYYHLGFVYRDIDQAQRAVLSFRRYLALNPEAREKKAIEDQIFNLSR